MGVSLDGRSVSRQYPRFVPFCLAVGAVALLGLVAILLLNIKGTKKLGLTLGFWFTEYFVAFFLSIPMIIIWEKLFDFLQNIF